MDILTPEEQKVFSKTDDHRQMIVSLLTAKGYPVNDNETLSVLLKTLNDIDKQHLNITKLKLAAGKEEDDKKQIALVASILSSITYEKRNEILLEEPELPVLPSNPDIEATITARELERPKAMGSAEAEYDASADDDLS